MRKGRTAMTPHSVSSANPRHPLRHEARLRQRMPLVKAVQHPRGTVNHNHLHHYRYQRPVSQISSVPHHSIPRTWQESTEPRSLLHHPSLHLWLKPSQFPLIQTPHHRRLIRMERTNTVIQRRCRQRDQMLAAHQSDRLSFYLDLGQLLPIRAAPIAHLPPRNRHHVRPVPLGKLF